MLIGVRTVLVILVPLTFALTSGVVDAWWWRTAQSNSRMLAGTLDRQIIGEVKRELDSLIDGAVAAQDAIRTVLVRNVIDVREADKRESSWRNSRPSRPCPGSRSDGRTGLSSPPTNLATESSWITRSNR